MSGQWKVAGRKCLLIIAQVNYYEIGVQLGVSLEFSNLFAWKLMFGLDGDMED